MRSIGKEVIRLIATNSGPGRTQAAEELAEVIEEQRQAIVDLTQRVEKLEQDKADVGERP